MSAASRRVSRAWSELRSFRRRRVAVPVGPRALVLDVGSGDKPHWRADVLVDRWAGSEHGGQRSGRAAAVVDRPLFEADAAALPFRDQAFDYVICSHTLEHVDDPAAVIAELARVGRAGYIEVPDAKSAKIVDFPSHRWWIRDDHGVLVFTAKSTPWFDPEIDEYLTSSGLRRPIAALLDRHVASRVIEHRWSGEIAHRVVGPTADHLVVDQAAAEDGHRGVEAFGARVAIGILSAPARLRRRTARRAALRMSDVVDLAPTQVDELLGPRRYRI